MVLKFNISRIFLKGFTLIEMLVVISIISILAALLMPVLGSSLESSRQIQCANQLKQIGYTFNSYAEDSKGWFPPFRGRTFRTATPTKEYWPVFLSAYLDRTYMNGRTSRLFMCPSDPKPREDDWFNFGYTASGSYGANNLYLPGWEDEYRRVTRQKAGGSLISDNTSLKLVLNPANNNFPSVFWHNERMNVLHIDCSVKPLDWSEFADRTY